MDPNATLRDLHDAIADHDRESVAEHIDALMAWIDRGGFLPAEWDDERLPPDHRRLAFRNFLRHTRNTR